MLRKIFNLKLYKFSSNCLSINRCFCSQIVKINENLSKCEEQKLSDNLTEISITNKNNNQKELTENERQELLSKIVKSPVQMDSFWEMSLEEKPKRLISYFDSKGGFSVDFLAALVHKYDFSIPGFKRRVKFYIEMRERYNLRYIRKRHAILGPELATAHFVVYRGGMVRFKHEPNVWVIECEKMPNIYDPRYRLIAVDASNTKLRYEAFDNFCLLDSLEELNLSKNKLLDDFVCDKIGRLFRNSKTLSVLDLSDNPLITHRGIETLHRIRSLKKLIISGTKAAKYPFIDLLIILFNDVNPNCHIVV